MLGKLRNLSQNYNFLKKDPIVFIHGPDFRKNGQGSLFVLGIIVQQIKIKYYTHVRQFLLVKNVMS